MIHGGLDLVHVHKLAIAQGYERVCFCNIELGILDRSHHQFELTGSLELAYAIKLSFYIVNTG